MNFLHSARAGQAKGVVTGSRQHCYRPAVDREDERSVAKLDITDTDRRK